MTTAATPPPSADQADLPFAKIDDLIDTLNRRLTGAITGKLYEGDKSTNNARHLQLPEVFALKTVLEEIPDDKDRKIRYLQAELERTRAEDKGVKMNGNQIATMREVAKAACEEQVRDCKVEIGRLKEENKQLRSALDRQSVRVENCEAKVKKSKAPAKEDKALSARVADLETGCHESREEMSALREETNVLQNQLKKKSGCTLREFNDVVASVSYLKKCQKLDRPILMRHGEWLAALQDSIANNNPTMERMIQITHVSQENMTEDIIKNFFEKEAGAVSTVALRHPSRNEAVVCFFHSRAADRAMEQDHQHVLGGEPLRVQRSSPTTWVVIPDDESNEED